jgi:hypothetical protein
MLLRWGGNWPIQFPCAMANLGHLPRRSACKQPEATQILSWGEQQQSDFCWQSSTCTNNPLGDSRRYLNLRSPGKCRETSYWLTSLWWSTGASPSFPVGFKRTAKKLGGSSFKFNVLDFEIRQIWSHTIFSSWYVSWRRFVMILMFSGVIGSGKPSLSSCNSSSSVKNEFVLFWSFWFDELRCCWLLFELLFVL